MLLAIRCPNRLTVTIGKASSALTIFFSFLFPCTDFTVQQWKDGQLDFISIPSFVAFNRCLFLSCKWFLLVDRQWSLGVLSAVRWYTATVSMIISVLLMLALTPLFRRWWKRHLSASAASVESWLATNSARGGLERRRTTPAPSERNGEKNWKVRRYTRGYLCSLSRHYSNYEQHQRAFCTAHIRWPICWRREKCTSADCDRPRENSGDRQTVRKEVWVARGWG